MFVVFLIQVTVLILEVALGTSLPSIYVGGMCV